MPTFPSGIVRIPFTLLPTNTNTGSLWNDVDTRFSQTGLFVLIIRTLILFNLSMGRGDWPTPTVGSKRIFSLGNHHLVRGHCSLRYGVGFVAQVSVVADNFPS